MADDSGEHLYVTGQVQGRELQFLYDTGANHTFVDFTEWEKIPEEERPQLEEPDRAFLLADGSPFKVFGRAYATVKVGGREVQQFPIWIAQLMDQAIMGSNLMAAIKCHWNWSQKKLVLEDSKVEDPTQPDTNDSTMEAMAKEEEAEHLDCSQLSQQSFSKVNAGQKKNSKGHKGRPRLRKAKAKIEELEPQKQCIGVSQTLSKPT